MDLACKAHDIAYDNADKAPDPLARAAMILEADRLLLARVASVSRDQDAGRQDLNMGEVLFLKNIQIAFRSKLIADGYHVIDFARKEEIKALVAGVINTQIAPSGYFFGTPLGRSAPILVRLYGRPPSH